MSRPVAGVRLGVAQAGIKHVDRDDLVLVELTQGSACVGLFTQNAFRAAPVQVAQQHLEDTAGKTRYWLINTGNANAGTGLEGYKTAELTCAAVAEMRGCHANEVLPFSTGVIGELLAGEPLVNALPNICADLAEDH
jgi:glutamate N-acetyltransferase/amino-acid N-acetyltransferase